MDDGKRGKRGFKGKYRREWTTVREARGDSKGSIGGNGRR